MARQLNAPNKVQNKVIMEQALGVIPALFDDFRRMYGNLHSRYGQIHYKLVKNTPPNYIALHLQMLYKDLQILDSSKTA